MNSLNHICSQYLRAILIRMRELGLSQSALAKRMNVSRAYVSKVLRGEEVNFTFASALRFAHALQMDFIPQMAVPSFDESSSTSSSPSTSNSPSSSNSLLQTPNFKLQTLSPTPNLALA